MKVDISSPKTTTSSKKSHPKFLSQDYYMPVRKSMAQSLRELITLRYEKDFDRFIYISIPSQRMYYVEGEEITKKYFISSAKKGIGNYSNSEKTPTGLHEIKRKIGDNVPYGGVFVSRRYSGNIAKIYSEKVDVERDDITSRILWLNGLERGVNKGRNKDSYKRCIYIHGTSEEGYIGNPMSHGCIRMRNEDVIELFESVKEHTPVLILNH